MADKSIGELQAAPTNLAQYDGSELFVLEQASTAKKLSMQTLESWLVAKAKGHGGISEITGPVVVGSNPTVKRYTIHYAEDETTTTFDVTDGAKGDTGDQTYVWIRWSHTEPTSDSDLSQIPDDWIGVYSGTSATAPTAYTAYSWYEYKGDKGDPGDPITSVTRTSGDGSPGTTDTYTVYVGETAVGTFNVYNGLNGTGAVSKVNNQPPDASGNVQLVPANIGAPVIPLHITSTLTTLPTTLSNASITADMRVVECVFGTPSAIRSDVSWTTSAGNIVLSGTMSGSTTVDIILIETT